MRNSTLIDTVILACLFVIFTIVIGYIAAPVIIGSALPPSVEYALAHQPLTMEERIASLEARMSRAEKWDGWAQEWLLWWGAK